MNVEMANNIKEQLSKMLKEIKTEEAEFIRKMEEFKNERK